MGPDGFVIGLDTRIRMFSSIVSLAERAGILSREKWVRGVKNEDPGESRDITVRSGPRLSAG
jgi:hypothetical protein